MERYTSLSRDQVLGNIPMMFITFPSAKDPTSNIRHPGNSRQVKVKVKVKRVLRCKYFMYFIMSVQVNPA